MVKAFLGEKAKKALLFKLFVGGASFVLLTAPFFARGSTFPLLSFLFGEEAKKSGAALLTLDSRSMSLLSPATNLDPNPSVGGGDITIVGGSALWPEQGPSGTAADIAVRPESSQISIYTVRKGDTLSEIAEMFDVSVNTIAWANDIQGRLIHEGQELIILPITGVRHTVVKGETLASIAKKYKGDLKEIANYNELATDAKLAVGDVIIIPDGIIAPAPSVPSTPLRGTTGPALAGYYLWPVVGGIKTQGLHGYNGIDIGAPRGTNILASAAGTVIVARTAGWNGGYGNYVVVQHSNGTQTLYAHTSSILVSVGDQVNQGQPIATVGATGRATGAHLHFEVRGVRNPF